MIHLTASWLLTRRAKTRFQVPQFLIKFQENNSKHVGEWQDHCSKLTCDLPVVTQQEDTHLECRVPDCLGGNPDSAPLRFGKLEGPRKLIETSMINVMSILVESTF